MIPILELWLQKRKALLLEGVPLDEIEVRLNPHDVLDLKAEPSALIDPGLTFLEAIGRAPAYWRGAAFFEDADVPVGEMRVRRRGRR